MYNNIWQSKNLYLVATERINKLHENLISHSLKDRSSEWFNQKALDAKYDIAGKYKEETVILRRARAIDAMLNALTDEHLSKNTFTSKIFDGELLLGTLPMGSNGLGKVFPTYLIEEEKRAGSITNRGSLSLFGHNTMNYKDLLNKGLEDVIKNCEEKIEDCEVNLRKCEEANYTPEEYKKEKKQEENQKDFYAAVKLSCQAVIDYAERMSMIALEYAEKESNLERRQELLEMARIAKKVPRHKADNFYEAIQSIWFFHVALHAGTNFISFGRLDQVLNPFLLKAKKKEYARCLEVFESFIIKAAWRLNLDLSPSNINKQDYVDNNTVLGVNPYLIDQKAGVNNFLQNIIIGGVTPEGEDAANDCTYLILKAFSNVNLSTPGLYIRVGEKNSDELKTAIADVWKNTNNNPAIINDNTMIPAMHKILKQGMKTSKKYIIKSLKKGFANLTLREKESIIKRLKGDFNKDFEVLSVNEKNEIIQVIENNSVEENIKLLECYYEETIYRLANDFCIDGCWEPILNGSSDWTFTMLCALTPLECALNEGAMLSNDPELLRGQKVAPRSAKPRSFEHLMEIFSKHLEFFIDQSAISLFLYYMMDEYACPSPLFSAYLDGCMESGKDKSWGGTRYNIGGIIMSGVPDVVNTLAAIKKYVIFEDDKENLDNVEISKKYELSVVIDALRNNFKYIDENHPIQNLFNQIKTDFNENSPTFGNNDDKVDDIAIQVLDYYKKAVKRSAKFAKKTFQERPENEAEEQRIKALRSIAGYYGESLEEKFVVFDMMISAGLGTFEQYNWSGRGNAASAGRGKGDPIIPNFSPAPGTVTHAVSGITETLSKLGLNRFAGGVITDVCIEPPQNPDYELKEILNYFIENNGGMMTLTIGNEKLYTKIYEEVSYAQGSNQSESVSKELIAKYAHINVRIGGWQTPFITLPFSHMQNYIKRPVAKID